jgi:flavin-dependent dehydrogenase
MAIAADGAQSILKADLAGFEMDPRHFCGAVRAYYSNIQSVQEDLLEVYFLKGYLPGYFWIFPLPGNRANVGFGMLTQTISERKLDLKKCLEDIITGFPEVGERFRGSVREGPVRGFGLPLGSRKVNLSGDRFLLTGDAASLIDPFSGEGIGNAMQSGIIAAGFAVKAIAALNFSADYLRAYDKAVYDKLGDNLRTSYRMQRILNDRAWLVNGLVSVAGRSRFIRNWLHKIM